jgi:RNA polymerase sigma factor (sigma-70 family)
MLDFEVFFELNYQPVVQGLRLAFGDRPGLEDAVQEAFAEAYVRWSSVGSMSRPGTWVYVVAVRRLRRALRRDARAINVILGRPASLAFEQRSVERIGLERALADLAPRQRATVVLRYLGGLSVAEVARALRCSQGTVKAANHAALAHLRVALEEARDER